jgi:hypothetical protein
MMKEMLIAFMGKIFVILIAANILMIFGGVVDGMTDGCEPNRERRRGEVLVPAYTMVRWLMCPVGSGK